MKEEEGTQPQANSYEEDIFYDGHIRCVCRYDGRSHLWEAIRRGMFHLRDGTGIPYGSFEQIVNAEIDAALADLCRTLITSGHTLEQMRKEYESHMDGCEACQAVRRRHACTSEGNATRRKLEKAIAQLQ